MIDYWPVVLFALGGLCLIGYCLLIRETLLPRQPIPTEYQLLAWLAILSMAAAVCFVMAAFLTER